GTADVEELWASAHPDLLCELLDALLDNAVKYSEPSSPIAVRTGGDANGVWVAVEDRGVGIAPEDLAHLFRPFFRSDAARRRGVPGVGLGLAVAHRIAVSQGGSLHMASRLGHGSTIRLTLPSVSVDVVGCPASTR